MKRPNNIDYAVEFFYHEDMNDYADHLEDKIKRLENIVTEHNKAKVRKVDISKRKKETT